MAGYERQENCKQLLWKNIGVSFLHRKNQNKFIFFSANTIIFRILTKVLHRLPTEFEQCLFRYIFSNAFTIKIHAFLFISF